MGHLLREARREWAKFPAPRPSILVVPSLPPMPLVQAPGTTPPTAPVLLKSLIKLCEDYCAVIGRGREKFCYHSFVLPLTAKMNLSFNYPGTYATCFGLTYFSLLLEGKLFVGRIYDRFTVQFSFPFVLCTQSPYSTGICSRKYQR